jgi:hypothetical protein
MKTVIAKGVYPDKWEQYSDGSACAICIECNEWRTINPTTFERFSKIYRGFDHWSKFYKCMQCFKQSIKAEELIKPMENKQDNYVKGAEWGMAFNLAFTKALKDHDMPLNSTFLGIVDDNHAKILAHIKELKQKTLNQ